MKLSQGRGRFLLAWAFNLLIYSISAHAEINVVAAEKVYGAVAKELGGPYVSVTSILNNPKQDPHLFMLAPSILVEAQKADILIFNGADYDPWMETVLSAKNPGRGTVIEVARLMNIQRGANPHIWYLPETMPVYAAKLVQMLCQLDPRHRSYFQERLEYFNQDNQAVLRRIRTLRQAFEKTPVLATEAVFNYLTERLGLQMHGEGFQKNMMNDVPPTVSQIKNFEDDLRQHHVRVLIYNKQVVNSETKRMLALAEQEGIPIVGVSEIMPDGLRFSQWLLLELAQLEKALQKSSFKKQEEKD